MTTQETKLSRVRDASSIRDDSQDKAIQIRPVHLGLAYCLACLAMSVISIAAEVLHSHILMILFAPVVYPCFWFFGWVGCFVALTPISQGESLGCMALMLLETFNFLASYAGALALVRACVRHAWLTWLTGAFLSLGLLHAAGGLGRQWA